MQTHTNVHMHMIANPSSRHLRVCQYTRPSNAERGGQAMAGENGLLGNVTLPSSDQLEQFDVFEIDFALGCGGPLDRDCPYWDHTVQLYVCCSDPGKPHLPCDTCGPTVWASIESVHRHGECTSLPAHCDTPTVSAWGMLQQSPCPA